LLSCLVQANWSRANNYEIKIWPDGTFVDFEGGLNAAMNKQRRALNDSADNPRYIETTPGLGYRFIGVIEDAIPVGLPAPPAQPPSSFPRLDKQSIRIRWWLTAGFACLFSFLLEIGFIAVRPLRPPGRSHGSPLMPV
jgi:hypothetical protein